MLLCFNISAHENVEVREVKHHNNPNKIKYYKNFKMAHFQLAPAETIKTNLLF
jgi:hypothetical protein